MGSCFLTTTSIYCRYEVVTESFFKNVRSKLQFHSSNWNISFMTKALLSWRDLKQFEGLGSTRKEFTICQRCWGVYTQLEKNTWTSEAQTGRSCQPGRECWTLSLGSKGLRGHSAQAACNTILRLFTTEKKRCGNQSPSWDKIKAVSKLIGIVLNMIR